MIAFTIPHLPEPLNVMQRKYRHHFSRHKYNKDWYDIVRIYSLRVVPKTPLKRVRLVVRMFRDTGRYLDYDGFVASLKPVVDGMKHAGLIFDDNYNVTGPWHCAQFKCKKGEVRLEIELHDETPIR